MDINTVVTTELFSVNNVKQFEATLSKITGLQGTLDRTTVDLLDQIFSELGTPKSISASEVMQKFYGKINRKLGSNKAVIANFYLLAFKNGVTFNTAQKNLINNSIDELDLFRLRNVLNAIIENPELVNQLIGSCVPVTSDETYLMLAKEVETPSKLRKIPDRKVSEDMFRACAGALVWSMWPMKDLFRFFGGGGEEDSYTDYIKTLEAKQGQFDRSKSLAISFISKTNVSTSDQLLVRAQSWIENQYKSLANHGYMALIFEHEHENASKVWTLVNQLTVFAERFSEQKIDKLFFRSREVQQNTLIGNPEINAEEANFEIACEGFTYRDLFILHDDSGRINRLVLLFQKNVRDETKIFCPSCRSSNVEGNSYPSMGVKSWECRNPICPDRSIYNRGKRFQLKSAIAQAAIENPKNEIEVSIIRRWQKDVLIFINDAEILEALIRFYSLYSDGVEITGITSPNSEKLFGRTVTYISDLPAEINAKKHDFWNSYFFKRFATVSHEHSTQKSPDVEISQSEIENQILCAESTNLLGKLPGSIFDRAITSPPYFNARDYSQWDNLYLYLNDMYLNAVEVFRTLKPGSIYIYNIFDYFDNERIITYSAMGTKRIPLAALITVTFMKIGFVLEDVHIWDKGDIQGKRGFNSGNTSPFYQSPFNCWEHVLIFKKPSEEVGQNSLLKSDVAIHRIHPVIKMINGENTYGHTAPFPLELPQRFLKGLEKGALVLDPYSGSGTTAIAAYSEGLKFTMIEQNPDYAELSALKIRNSVSLNIDVKNLTLQK